MSSSSSSSSSSPTKPRPSQPLLRPPPPPRIQTRPPTPQPPTTTTTTTTWHPPLLLTVRFSASIPDLLLDIPHPSQTTVVALKHLIRTRLAEPNSQRRLRFISAGKILPDAAVLSAVLKAPPAPPAPTRTTRPDAAAASGRRTPDPKGKGKAVAGRSSDPPQRVYVNCSIGDSLTDEELAHEAEAALQEPAAPAPEQQQTGARDTAAAAAAAGPQQQQQQQQGRWSPQGPAMGAAGPRGFDRLLSTGFTAAEVNQLRLQFRSVQAARHTADTLPSPDAMRAMEDAWIDNNGTDTTAGAAAGGDVDAAAAVAEGAGEEFGMSGMLDVMLRGMFIGFVWPLGALGWLTRGEEKIPQRMKLFIYFGFVLSLLLGTIRAIN